MKVKLFEVRDNGTCIAAIAIKPGVGAAGGEALEARRFLLGKSGWHGNTHGILFGYLEGRELHADPYDWPDNPRTMRIAHIMAERAFDELAEGAVRDVRTTTGERDAPVESDRFYMERA